MDEAIVKYLKSEDPLSKDAIKFLLEYREEDHYIDYKETIEKNNNKEWIELAKDIMAFANSHGGYLLYGVQDSTYNLIGLDKGPSAIVKNTDMIQQKINRYTEPEILNLRSKEHAKKGKIFVVLFIPESLNKTHVVSKDAVVNYPSGDKKTLLHKGTVYVRRSAGNHLCDSRDLDELISKRIKHFKKNLLSNISRVVEAPAESDVFILSQDPTAKTNKKFIIEDAPDAIKIKGMSFAVSPETIEQEVSAWISLSKKEVAALPPPKILWKWYFQRESLNLSEMQRLILAKFCMVSDVPAFYWIKGCAAESISKVLDEAIALISSKTRVDIIVGIAAFLGKTIYKKTLNRIKAKYQNRLPQKACHFPSSDPSCLFSQELVESSTTIKQDEEINLKNQDKLNQIAKSVLNNGSDQPGVMERRTAHAIDCELYAQHDKYKTKHRTT